MTRLYHPTPDGYCGDEDNGQTSAWYVWSTLGFYPVCPVSGEYVLGVPFFDRVTIRLSGDRTVDVLKPDHATDEPKVRFNQSVLADFVISREMLKTGGVLR